MPNAQTVRAGAGETLQLGAHEELLVRLRSEDTGNVFSCVEDVLGYLAGPPLHIHRNQDEYVYVLDGELKFSHDGEMFDIRAGDIVCTPQGMAHTFTNLSESTPARTTALHTPGGFDEFVRVWAAMPPGPSAPAKIAEVAKQFGQVVTGPPLAVTLGVVTQ